MNVNPVLQRELRERMRGPRAMFIVTGYLGLLVGIFYCLGLGIPFVLVALGFGWVGSSIAWVKRHIRAINIAGGALLIVIGLLMVTGVWTFVMSGLGVVIGGIETPL